MKSLKHLFENNRAWALGVQATDPKFFSQLAQLQTPEYLWIGCSDSRVPANQITGLLPGEVFVHRNIANVVVHTDLNCLSVIQYAVDILKVKHIIVCGHYGCGGVQAALNHRKLGLADNWIRHIQDVVSRYESLLPGTGKADWDRLCELNVISQVVNVAQTSILQDAWERGQEVNLHGWVYSLDDGLLRDLQMEIGGSNEIATRLVEALQVLSRKV